MKTGGARSQVVLAVLVAIAALVVARAEARVVPSIPFEEKSGHLFIQGRVNGARGLWFCLDTGSGASLLNTRCAAALGIPLVGTRPIRGVGGVVAGSAVQDVRVWVPGGQCRYPLLEALDLEFLSIAKGTPVALLLGAEFFRRFVVEIDYVARRIRLHEPSRFAYRGPGRRIPIRFDGPHPWIRATLYGRDGAPVTGDFLIDSGSDATVILSPGWRQRRRLAKTLERSVPVQSRGIGATITNLLGRLRGLKVGPYVVAEPLALFPHGGEFGAPGRAGSVGGGFLRRFRVILDYSRRQMILEPNRNFREPEELDMSGLRFADERPATGEVTVTRVAGGSPADEAGLRPGDEIVSLDDIPTAETTLAELRQRLKQRGRTCRVTVRRGDQVIEVALRLRRLL